MANESSKRRRQAFDRVQTVGSELDARLAARNDPATLAVVDRHGLRNVVFQCPCGCGETVSINVDPAAGPSWRVRINAGDLTLMPSVWRTSGCGSHFVLWSSRIWWCSSDEGVAQEWPDEMDAELKAEWTRILSRWRGGGTDRPE
jgi:hypothetical protein